MLFSCFLAVVLFGRKKRETEVLEGTKPARKNEKRDCETCAHVLKITNNMVKCGPAPLFVMVSCGRPP